MATIRRFYIYAVCAVVLQSVTWAVIVLLRSMLIPALGAATETTAFEIAVILIGLPVYLMHWFWGQRLAFKDEEERLAGLRRFYLFAMLTGFLAPWLTNAYDLIGSWLRAAGSLERLIELSGSKNITSYASLYHLTALLVLGLLWYYHWRTHLEDFQGQPQTGIDALLRRLYVFGGCAAGLSVTTQGVIDLLRLIFTAGDLSRNMVGHPASLADTATRLVIGLPLWLVFWLWAQRLFRADEEERQSALRKFYLYSVLFAAVSGTVGNTTFVFAGILRRLVGLPPRGDIRLMLPVIVSFAVLWIYHAYILRQDMQVIPDAPRQAGVRRLYQYLVAAVGLAALVGGLGGDISVILRSFEESFGDVLKEQFSGFTAALLAGLPVWILPWRDLQGKAVEVGEIGAHERQSLVRKIYLYFYLFVAIMTVLSSAIYLVYRLLSAILGGAAPTLSGLGQAAAFALIGAGVLAYHGAAVRTDGRMAQQEQTKELAGLEMVVIPGADAAWAQNLVAALKQRLPLLNVQILSGETEAGDILARAGLIIAPSGALLPGVGDPQVVQAVASSPARKLLVPTWLPGWDWAGIDRWGEAALVKQTEHAIEQIIKGQETHAVRPMNIAAIILIGMVILFVLMNIVAAISNMFFQM